MKQGASRAEIKKRLDGFFCEFTSEDWSGDIVRVWDLADSIKQTPFSKKTFASIYAAHRIMELARKAGDDFRDALNALIIRHIAYEIDDDDKPTIAHRLVKILCRERDKAAKQKRDNPDLLLTSLIHRCLIEVTHGATSRADAEAQVGSIILVQTDRHGSPAAKSKLYRIVSGTDYLSSVDENWGSYVEDGFRVEVSNEWREAEVKGLITALSIKPESSESYGYFNPDDFEDFQYNALSAIGAIAERKASVFDGYLGQQTIAALIPAVLEKDEDARNAFKKMILNYPHKVPYAMGELLFYCQENKTPEKEKKSAQRFILANFRASGERKVRGQRTTQPSL